MANKKVLGEIFDALGGEIPGTKQIENGATESGQADVENQPAE